jgi:hypothetical protein
VELSKLALTFEFTSPHIVCKPAETPNSKGFFGIPLDTATFGATGATGATGAGVAVSAVLVWAYDINVKLNANTKMKIFFINFVFI